MIDKLPLGINVLQAARERIDMALDTFERLCVSFSGGKDSTVLLHLVAERARLKGRTFSVLFIDWEVQFACTIDHIQRMKALYRDVTDAFYWVALPMTTVSGVSQSQPEWVSWEEGVPWVRQPPEDAITDPAFFPFYQSAMTFEAFVPAFSKWWGEGASGMMFVGIRTDESLNRMMAIASQRKRRYSPVMPWTSAWPAGNGYCGYPLYDWKVGDIWTYFARETQCYNPLYDLMYRAGVSPGNMRICEPFGPEQRRGLWLYHVLEPETWGRACERVSGACSGARYGNQSGAYFSAHVRIARPAHHTWQSYALFLLDSMPAKTAQHYRTKIAIYLKWYLDRDYPQGIPEEQEKDLGSRDIPSWRRICRVLIRNDFWCRALSFGPNKPQHYSRYLRRMQKKREEWGLL